MSASAASPSIAERIRAIVRRAIRSVTRRLRQEAEMGAPVVRGAGTDRPAMPAAAVAAAAMDCVAAFGLKARCDRLLALMARIQAGVPAPPRLRASSAEATGALPTGAVPVRRRAAPRASGWLAEAAADCRPYGGILLDLIEEPGIRAMCLASPQMRREFAPMLYALGAALPEWMAKRAKPQRRRAAPTHSAVSGHAADEDRAML